MGDFPFFHRLFFHRSMDGRVGHTSPYLRDQAIHGAGLRQVMSLGVGWSHSTLRRPVIAVAKKNLRRITTARGADPAKTAESREQIRALRRYLPGPDMRVKI